MKSFTVSAACARWAAPLAALGLCCTALPQADELEALASQQVAQQASWRRRRHGHAQKPANGAAPTGPTWPAMPCA